MPEKLRIAIIGNPNSGKSTIFNSLTGARQHVANYPGVTVEGKEGLVRRDGVSAVVVDLPGIYSLSAAASEDEIVAREYLLGGKADVVIDVVDASNLERNLYLAVELMELGAPLVVALNMMDAAAARGVTIDVTRLSGLLGVPVVPTVGTRGEGLAALVDTALGVATKRLTSAPALIPYGAEIEDEISAIESSLDGEASLLAAHSARWLATKLLEDDTTVAARLARVSGRADGILAQVENSRRHVRSIGGDEAETLLAERRYGFIAGACQEAVTTVAQARRTLSDRIDAVMTHRALGLPILMALMYLVFYAAFRVANAPGQWIADLLGVLAAGVTQLLSADGGSTLTLRSLLLDGVIGGVGGVVMFLPNVMVLFLAIAVLEDSGYMARAAFVTDGLMHKMGLHGKSFIPMVIGFGCSVPAIMATRIIENRKGRLATMMVIPLVSCGARLPVYALLIPAFFAPEWRAAVLWSVYAFGVVLAVVIARMLRNTVLAGESQPLVMELPPYRIPTVKGLLIHAWQRSWMYVRKAGTVILTVSIVLWFAANWPSPPQAALDAARSPAEAHSVVLANSLIGRIGHAIEPGLRPIGFDWRAGTAFLGAVAAKEVFVSQMGIVFAANDGSTSGLGERLRAQYGARSGIAMILFMLIANPCAATLAVTRRESGSWKWAAAQWLGLTVLGYMIALVAYQGLSLAGLGG